MPGIGVLMEGAMQHAAQPVRQAMAAGTGVGGEDRMPALSLPCAYVGGRCLLAAQRPS